MKSRSRIFVAGALLSVALLATATSRADSTGGTFTLPFAVTWGNSVLPAGRYSFTVVSSLGSSRYLDVRGAKIGAFIFASGTEDAPKSAHNSLTVVTAGHVHYVQKMTLKVTGTSFVFSRPAIKSEKQSRPVTSRIELGG